MLRLLKRRKLTLAAWLKETGLTTYPDTLRKCDRLGVLPPSEVEFAEACPVIVSNQTSGVVVLPEIPVIDERSGREIDVPLTWVPEDSIAGWLQPVEDKPQSSEATDASEQPTKKTRRKRED